MKKQEHFLLEGHRSSFCIKVTFGIDTPHLHIKSSLYVCSRVQGSQIFKWNSIISIRSKVIAFLAMSLSPWGHRNPRIVPVIPTSSPHHPHSSHKVPMWSPWLWSPLSPPHIVPIIPVSFPSSPHHPHHPHIVTIAPTRSWCGPHGCGLCCLHPMLSLLSPSAPHYPTSSLSSPLHPHVI